MLFIFCHQKLPNPVTALQINPKSFAALQINTRQCRIITASIDSRYTVLHTDTYACLFVFIFCKETDACICMYACIRSHSTTKVVMVRKTTWLRHFLADALLCRSQILAFETNLEISAMSASYFRRKDAVVWRCLNHEFLLHRNNSVMSILWSIDFFYGVRIRVCMQ